MPVEDVVMQVMVEQRAEEQGQSRERPLAARESLCKERILIQ